MVIGLLPVLTRRVSPSPTEITVAFPGVIGVKKLVQNLAKLEAVQ